MAGAAYSHCRTLGGGVAPVTRWREPRPELRDGLDLARWEYSYLHMMDARGNREMRKSSEEQKHGAALQASGL